MAYTTINKPSLYFNTVLYTGDGTTNRSITGVGFKPDWTWIKSRSNAYYHEVYDVVRGFASTTNGRRIFTNVTTVQDTPNTFNSFNTDGFTVSNQTGETGTNGNGATFVAWNWLGSNTTTSNTSGSVTSTVSVNTTSGFSVVKWTTSGSSGNNTIGHGLGVAPKMIFMKAYDVTYNWDVFHASIMSTGVGRLILNSTATYSTAFSPFGSVAPTSTVFSNDVGFYGNGQNVVAYCFAQIKGYSNFGSYTGNGSTDGVFVYTGFKPAYIMIKVTSTTADDWNVLDNKRDPTNEGSELVLYPDLSNAEGSAVRLDFLSNGFKCRTTNVSVNSNGLTYIYAAFAENPFVSATAIPTTAR